MLTSEWNTPNTSSLNSSTASLFAAIHNSDQLALCELMKLLRQHILEITNENASLRTQIQSAHQQMEVMKIGKFKQFKTVESLMRTNSQLQDAMVKPTPQTNENTPNRTRTRTHQYCSPYRSKQTSIYTHLSPNSYSNSLQQTNHQTIDNESNIRFSPPARAPVRHGYASAVGADFGFGSASDSGAGSGVDGGVHSVSVSASVSGSVDISRSRSRSFSNAQQSAMRRAVDAARKKVEQIEQTER
jgi:hypothetical protein